MRALPRRPVPEVPARPAKPVEPPDIDFKSQLCDVTPLADDGRVHFAPPRPSPHPRKRARAHSDRLHPHPVGWFEPAHSDNQFVRAGMQGNTLKKLRALHWPVCAELDLHGYDRYQAQDRLAIFLHQARRLGNCVRIIHGRGIGSSGEPVLKRMTRTWLSHHPEVLAWSESHEGGALLVLLKRMTD